MRPRPRRCAKAEARLEDSGRFREQHGRTSVAAVLHARAHASQHGYTSRRSRHSYGSSHVGGPWCDCVSTTTESTQRRRSLLTLFERAASRKDRASGRTALAAAAASPCAYTVAAAANGSWKGALKDCGDHRHSNAFCNQLYAHAHLLAAAAK